MAKLLTVSITVLILFAAYTATQNTPGPTKSPPVDSIFDEIKSLNCTATDPNTCNADHIKVNTSAKDVCDRLTAAKICTDNCTGEAKAVKDSLDNSWKDYNCDNTDAKGAAVNSIFDQIKNLNCTDPTTCKADHIKGDPSAKDVCDRLTATKTCTDNCIEDTKEVKDSVAQSWRDYNCDNTDAKGAAVNSIFDQIKNLNCTDPTTCKADHIKGDPSAKDVCDRLTATKTCTDHCTGDTTAVKTSLTTSWKDYNCDSCSLLHGSGLLLILAALVNRLL